MIALFARDIKFNNIIVWQILGELVSSDARESPQTFIIWCVIFFESENLLASQYIIEESINASAVD
jgi:hypothetical protein